MATRYYLKEDKIDKYAPPKKQLYTAIEGHKRVEKWRELPQWFGKEGEEVFLVADHNDVMIVENKAGTRTSIRTELLNIVK